MGETVAGSLRRAALILAALILGSCATRSAHYYADDGPPDHVPKGLAATPDAVPHIEPLSPHANRPYAAMGRTYAPDTSDAPFQQRGIASWYGRQFQGNRTASGEPYDMFAMTAAHPTLPIPSYARVSNLRDGRSVIVRINDRGPFLHDRIIDLSYAAATRLGIAGPGSGEVSVQKITAREIAARTYGPGPVVAAAPAPPMGAAASVAPVPVATSLAVAPIAPIGNLSAERTPTTTTNWSVQLGAFAVPAKAEALRDRLALLLSAPEADGLPPSARTPRVEYDGKLNRVLIGSLDDRTLAQAWAQQLGRFLVRETALYAR